MKKIISYLFVAITVTLVVSCASRTERYSYSSYPTVPFFCTYTAGSVKAVVDHVKEDRLASQMLVIAGTYLKAKQKYGITPDTTILLIDFDIEQRSFMHDVELYNSVYVSCLVRDEAGTIYGKENEYIAGKRTIISAVEQNRIVTRLLKRILAPQAKRYRDARRYRKTHEK